VSFPRAAAHTVREVAHHIKYGVDVRHDVLAVDEDRSAARCAQRRMQDGPVFRHVDPGSPEHRVDAIAEARGLGETAQECDRLVRDTILGIVDKDAGPFRGEALAACRVIGKERTQVQPSDFLVMCLERFPCRARRE
jgi:hypothetical protein